LDAYPAFPGSTEAPRFDPEAPVNPEPHADEPAADIHLRSTNAVKGCHIKAVDGSIGHVSGFVFDDVAWVIRYLSVDTRNWWPGGKEVLLATQWIRPTGSIPPFRQNSAAKQSGIVPRTMTLCRLAETTNNHFTDSMEKKRTGLRTIRNRCWHTSAIPPLRSWCSGYGRLE
jgi:hypothetical protein